MKHLFHLIAVLFIFSCTPARKAMYFPDIEHDVAPIDSLAREAAKRVYPGDRLQLQIVVQDEEGMKMLNPLGQGGGGSQIGQNTANSGYLIDPDGMIEIPTLGKLLVSGMTPMEIREMVRSQVAVLYKDPVVYCTISGRVLILEKGGEGGGSGSIPLVNERLTILEALAGTTPQTMKLDKVWVIREIEGKRQVGLVNLNSTDVFHSPFFYLRNNDLIYIEPNRTNRFIEANAPYRNLLGIVTGFTGIVLAIIALSK